MDSIYQGIFEICTDLGILVVNAKYAQKYTVAYTRFFAQCACHLESTAGHMGEKRTVKRITERYIWNGIVKDVK